MKNLVKAISIIVFGRKSLNKIFTPNNSAQLSYVSRESIEKALKNNLLVIGRPIILYGHSGGGKTTVVNHVMCKLKAVPIITSCESNSTMEDIVLNAFDSLDPYYVSNKKSSVSIELSGEIKKEFACIKSSINQSEETTSTRALPPQLRPQKLAQFMGAVNAVWVIEDFHKISAEERKKIADIIKIFIDVSNQYQNVKIICIGAVDSPQKILEQDDNLRGRVSDVRVPLLTDDEIKNLILKGCDGLNIEIENALIDKIVYYSGNLASIAHKMCFDICCEKHYYKTQYIKKKLIDKDFDIAVEAYLRDNSSKFQSIYDISTKDSLGWYVLKALNSQEVEMPFKRIKKFVNHDGRKFTEYEIQEKLELFTQPEYDIVYYNPLSNKYVLSSPFWRSFLRMKIAREKSKMEKSFKDGRNPHLILEDQSAKDAFVYKRLLDMIDDMDNRMSSNSSIQRVAFKC